MQRFYFGGFLPRKAGERKRELAALAALDATLVFFESPHRAAASLAALAEAFPGRRAALARELTKLFEEVVRGPVEEVAEAIAERGEGLKGEVVLLVGPPVEQERAPLAADDVRTRVDALIGGGLSKSAAVRRAAEELGLPRSEVYEIAHRP